MPYKNKKNILLIVLLSLLTIATAQEKESVRIACIGNSITYGAGINNPYQNSYPGILQQLFGNGYDVRNFGFSSRTMLRKGDYPYMNEQMYKDAQNFMPNIVTIKLGTNDSKQWNWKYKKDFKKDLEEMVTTFLSLPTRPEIYLCLPVPAAKDQYGINDSIIKTEIIPIIKHVAKQKKVHLIDLHTALLPFWPQYFPDYVHPNEQGSVKIANKIYNAITAKEPEIYPLGQAFPGKKSNWEGFDRYDFICNGRDAIVVTPKHPATGNPWIWRPAFFGAFASVDKALLEKGFHVAYYDLTHLYGSPRALSLGSAFYDIICRYYNLSPKVTLEGFSRGGLFAFNWGAKNADKVACVYVDAPVCNMQSWPGRKDQTLWNELLKEWNVKDADADSTFKASISNATGILAKAGVPIITVCGDSDNIVPYKENMQTVRDAYQTAGGVIELILKPGCNHHPHSLENPEPITDFILRYQKGYADKNHINLRSRLTNSFNRFITEKKGCVAFVGGSITEMDGWRNMIKESLKQRFPYTEFTFVEAGISSTGSTPHAFRLQNDVLDKCTPDLMFVEAAVNDDTNGFTSKEQVRGMEGIIRHALKTNSKMDIVMLHFIYDPFIQLLKEGVQPDVIMNHERVANYYRITSINLAQEIADRMVAGEFTWEHFGGTHPSPYGHKYYAATINALFDIETKNDIKAIDKAHIIPEKPLDEYCYESGEFISINSAKELKGFKHVDKWSPSNRQVETRRGFVNVPMLVSDKAGASFSLDFTGKGIGIFCVAGPHAATLLYSIDGTPFKRLATHTEWSDHIYLPWVYMLETELHEGKHSLTVKIDKGDKAECQIRNFVVNR
ncbi:MAG: GDSL-type esterase/lipase family protein [Bacteroidales bacterium]